MTTDDALAAAIGDAYGRQAADRLCRACVELLGVDCAAISLVVDGRNVGTLGASNDRARQYDELQFTLGEGPGLDAVAARTPLSVTDLAAAVDDGQWPKWGPALLACGVRAVFAFPVEVEGDYLAALNLFHTRDHHLDTDDVRTAMEAATLAARPLLDLLADMRPARTIADPSGSMLSRPSASEEWNTALRAEVHIAIGMLIEQLSLTAPAATDRLRAHAYATNRSVTDIAHDIIGRRLQLDLD